MSMLADRLLAVHAALDGAGFAHAFGGAIALAYCTEEPRGTRDLDVNVFVPVERADEVLDAMPNGVTVTPTNRARLRRDGQVRVMWEDTPVDLFLDTHPFHGDVARGVVEVPFANSVIPVLDCEALVVFKAMFNRPKDWVDIQTMIASSMFDAGNALARLRSLLDDSDPAVIRLSTLTGE